MSNLDKLIRMTLKCRDKFYLDTIEWYVRDDGSDWFPYPLGCLIVLDEDC